jgi:uncharacterized protein DUF3575
MMLRSSCVRTLFLAVTITLAGGALASAQTTAPTLAGERTQVISANPFTSMFKWFNAEYERKLTPNVTWGATGTFFSIDGIDYKNAGGVLRYYPSDALHGFFLGGRTGVYRLSAITESATFYGAGFELGYTWLLGRRENVAVSIGAGVNRLFGGELSGASLAIPSLRLVNIGYAF